MGDLLHLHGDDDVNPVPAEWGTTLAAYLDQQDQQPLRDRLMSTTGGLFPGADNDMLRYLIETAVGQVDARGVEEAVVWLAVHAWREGALDWASKEAKTDG